MIRRLKMDSNEAFIKELKPRKERFRRHTKEERKKEKQRHRLNPGANPRQDPVGSCRILFRNGILNRILCRNRILTRILSRILLRNRILHRITFLCKILSGNRILNKILYKILDRILKEGPKHSSYRILTGS